VESDRLTKLAELCARYPELAEDQLSDVEELLVGELATAADAKDVSRARSLGGLLDKTRGEQRRRRVRREEDERELQGLLTKAGLAESEPEPEPEVEAPALVAALRSSTPKISDFVRVRRASGTPLRRVAAVEGSRWTTPAGAELHSVAEVAGEIANRMRTQTLGKVGRFAIATARWELGSDRTLGQDVIDNRAKLEAVLSPPALLASGGICAPPSPKYDFPGGSTGSRPLRDGLPRFDGNRGGIVYLPSPTLADADAGVGITTEAQDATGENYPKPCLVVSCDDATELQVQAIHRCLQFSNFNARTHPEAVEEYVNLTIAAVARAAEDSLWSMMVSASTAVTAGASLSATREVLAAVGRAAAQVRSRHRLPQDFTIRWAAPAWLIDLLQADMGYQLPGDSSMGITRAEIEAWLTARSVRPIWSLDGGQAFTAAQGVGALTAWPTEVETILYPEGAFVHVDGGELDLGVVRDSTLNTTNDLQIFGEVFETVAFVGVESYALTLDVCPSGTSAGVDLDNIACAS
jgi:hypothetical protein